MPVFLPFSSLWRHLKIDHNFLHAASTRKWKLFCRLHTGGHQLFTSKFVVEADDFVILYVLRLAKNTLPQRDILSDHRITGYASSAANLLT